MWTQKTCKPGELCEGGRSERSTGNDYSNHLAVNNMVDQRKMMQRTAKETENPNASQIMRQARHPMFLITINTNTEFVRN